jgi:glycosyltransferase involved in cell wall biosynthesis
MTVRGENLKIIQIPFCFAPDPVGGTEVYLAGVAQDLKLLGVNVVIVAPGLATHDYTIDGLRVRRFAVSSTLDLVQLYGLGDAKAAGEFTKILDEEAPDLVHLHALTPATSLQLVRSVKKRNIPIMFTYHTPTVTCQRGTLMRWGSEICDGALDAARCTACTLHGAGLHRRLAVQIGKLPPAFGNWLGKHRLQGGVWTALRMSDLLSIRRATFHELASEVDHFVAVCDWARDVLLVNDIPAERISMSRQGLNCPQQEFGESLFSAGKKTEEVSFVFVGRLDWTKGLHVLINAFRLAPGLNIKLDVFGVVQTQANAAYRLKMLRLARNDPRITFCHPIASHEVVSTMRHYDFVAVPSQWLETGPMVVLEAFAAGTPVIGSRHSGMAEIVRDGVDGLLIDRNVRTGWADALHRLAQNPNLRAELRAGVRPPRSSRDVAKEMLALYRSMC